MADTLLTAINRILRATGQRTVSVFADTNSSNWLVDRYNEAIHYLNGLNPTPVDVGGALTLPASTRTLTKPTGLDLYRIYDWSWRINDSAGDIPLSFVTYEFILRNYPLFESEEADKPKHVYFDGDAIAFYPLLKTGSSSLTIQFKYPAMMTRLSATTDMVPFEENSDESNFCEYYCRYEYEVWKGLGNPANTGAKLDDLDGKLAGKYARARRQGLQGYRRYGR